MKKADLITLGISEEIADQVIIAHGKDIESLKAKNVATQTEADSLKAQIAEANTAIESFKKLDVDGIKAAADDWKLKAEKAQTDAAVQLADLKFNHALEGALAGAKAKNSKAVLALLSKDGLKFNEADGTIIGLTEQLEKIRSENDYLFADTTPPPQIVKGGNNQSVLKDPQLDAMRKAAGLT
jgi:ABC-type glutathione transport system ATPase component